jgi:phage tail-like protein
MKSRTFLVVLLGVVLGFAAAVGVVALESESRAAGAGVGVPGPGDGITAARFELTIDGHSLAVFSELQGISSGYDTSELELLTRASDVLLKAPAKRKPTSVTLKRGMTSSVELAAWHDQALTDNAAARKTATLTMYNTTGDPVARYHLENAWPSKLVIDALTAGASEVLFETVTFVADRVTRVSP